jgi:phosphatidylserine/phosphatidylglycerophosphate/cardiolipin synthase-like enzyme
VSGGPLQPRLRPTPPWLSRLLLLCGLIVAMLALGLADQLRRRPPELLLSDGHPLEAARALERRFAAARTRIWVAMFVIRCETDPDQASAAADDPVVALLRALAAARARGVDVRVCLDYGRDRDTGEVEDKHVIAQAWLARHGIPVVLDEEATTTHAKVVLIDARWVVLGSHNWTRSALTRNREASVLLDDAAVAQRVAEEVFARIPGWQESRGAESQGPR